jgi:hypothetical protein
MNNEVAEFWLVWNPKGGAPTYKHLSVKEALAEARRLSGTCPGHEFFVLKAIGGYQMPAPGPQPIVIDDGIPF